MNEKQIGPFLKSLREERHLTQDQLSEILLVDRTTISKWESNKSIPLNDTLTLLGEFYNVSVNEILAGERFTKEELNFKNARVTLSLLAKKNKLKFILYITIALLIITLSVFFIYYFIATYKSIHIYSIRGIGECESCLNTKNGLVIISKDDIYIRIGSFYNIKNEKVEIHKVDFYVIDNGKEKVIYSGDPSTVIVDVQDGKQYLIVSKLKSGKHSYYLRVYIDDETTETINLTINNDFTNDDLIYTYDNNTSKFDYPKTIISKLKNNKNFKYDKKNLAYTFNEDNLKITCFTNLNGCDFLIENNDIEIRYYYDYFDNILEYRKKKNVRLLDDYRIDISNMNKEDERIFNNFKNNYFDKYIYK
jgi:transcriptional regulator with XRE-family HTH domain